LPNVDAAPAQVNGLVNATKWSQAPWLLGGTQKFCWEAPGAVFLKFTSFYLADGQGSSNAGEKRRDV